VKAALDYRVLFAEDFFCKEKDRYRLRKNGL
jgi:hypothetical protein